MHTPTPWEIVVRKEQGKLDTYEIWNGPIKIALVWNLMNAALIVKAVNSYEAMREALAIILDDYTHGTWCPDSDEIIPKIRHALTLAEGKE